MVYAVRLVMTVLISAATLWACAPASQDHQRIRIAFPKLESTATQKAGSLYAKSTTSPTVNMDAAPGSMGDFACFGLNVAGPGIPNHPELGRGESKCQDGAPDQIPPGMMIGLAPINGGELEVMVPAGEARTFQLFALRSESGCPNLDQLISDRAGTQFKVGRPFEIGRTTADIKGDATVVIKAGYDPRGPRPIFCDAQRSSGSGTGSTTPKMIGFRGPRDIPPNMCSSFEFGLLNEMGEPIPPAPSGSVENSVVATLSGHGSGMFFFDPACMNPIPGLSVTLSSTQPMYRIFYKSPIMQQTKFMAMANGFEVRPFDVNVGGGTSGTNTGNRFKLQLSNSSIGANDCVQIPLNLIDPANSPMAAPYAIQVNLNTNLGGFYTNPSCGPPVVNSVAIAAGQMNIPLFFKAGSSGSVNIGVNEVGIVPPNFGGDMLALTAGTGGSSGGSVPKLAVIPAASSIVSLGCLSVTIQTQDAASTPQAVTSNTTINLGTSAGTFYTTAACSASLTSTMISAGTHSATVFYKYITAGGVNLTASDPGAIYTSASAPVTVTAGPAAQIQIISPGSNAGVTFSSFPVGVQITDASGNPVSEGGHTGITIGAYTDVGCSASHASPPFNAGGVQSSNTSGQATLAPYFSSSLGGVIRYFKASSSGGLIGQNCVPFLVD